MNSADKKAGKATPATSVRQNSIESKAGPRKTPPIPPKDVSVKPILFAGLNCTAGDGLWCIVKDKPEPAGNGGQSSSKNNLNKPADTGLNAHLDKRVESSLVSVLEKEARELGIELEKEKAASQELRMTILKMKTGLDNYEAKVRELRYEADNERAAKLKLDQELDKLREAYNKLKRDYSKTTAELASEVETNQNLNLKVNELLKQRDADENHYKMQLRAMQERIEEAEEEVEDKISRQQQRDMEERRQELEKKRQEQEKKQSAIEEKGNKVEKMYKLMEENATLNERLKESDDLKRKYGEKLHGTEAECKKLLQERAELSAQIAAFKKREKDLASAKSTNQKVLEDKIKKLTEANENMQKELEKAKKSTKKQSIQPESRSTYGEEEEVLESVTAKPFLFGPVDKMNY